MKDKLLTWLKNSVHIHHRLMANYLRPRGWVVFYLDEPARQCNKDIDLCWLQLYEGWVRDRRRENG